MAKTSFKKTATVEDVSTEVATQDVSTEVATLGTAPTAPSSPYAEEYEQKDIEIPRLNLAQKVGELGDIFTPGEVIYNKELVLPTPFIFVVVGVLPKQFSEKLVGGALGRLLPTRQAVLDVGGVFTKKEAEATGKPHFQDMVTADLLIEKPEGLEDENGLFAYEAGGKGYAPARYTMKGTGYFAVARKLFSARSLGSLKTGWSTGVWSYEVGLETFGTNKVFVPIVKGAGPTSPELLDLCNQFAGRE